jgi:hypothetical protein
MLRACGSTLRPTSKHRVANTFSMLRTPFPMLRTLFSCCAPSLLPRHSVHVASDVTSLWRTCCELVTSMLRPPSKTSDARLMGGWEGVRFFPRRTPDQEHYRSGFYLMVSTCVPLKNLLAHLCHRLKFFFWPSTPFRPRSVRNPLLVCTDNVGPGMHNVHLTPLN